MRGSDHSAGGLMPTRDHDDAPGFVARHYAARYGRDVPARRPDTAAAIDLHRTEYAELKDEQRTRMTTRDNLGYATWGAIGLVIAAGRVTGPTASPVLWLALPFVVVVLGWTRLQNDNKITRIGEYIRYDLAPRVSRLAGEPVFNWESAHNGPGSRHQLRMVCQLVVDLALYAAAPAAALMAFWTTAMLAWPWLVVSVLEALAVTGLAAMITLQSGVRLRGRDTSGAVTDTQTVAPSMPSQNKGA
jgi:hypothetical protein